MTVTQPLWLAAGVDECFCPDYHYTFFVAYCCEARGPHAFNRIHECRHRHRTLEAALKCLPKLKRELGYVEPSAHADSPTPEGGS